MRIPWPRIPLAHRLGAPMFCKAQLLPLFTGTERAEATGWVIRTGWLAYTRRTPGTCIKRPTCDSGKRTKKLWLAQKPSAALILSRPCI